jgi:hypothetical protein
MMDAGLVQVVVDNFDAEISSPNGKLSTHSLAVLLTQPETDDQPCQSQRIQRITKEEMSKPIEYNIEIQRYQGSKKPKMPKSDAVHEVFPLKLLAQQVISRRRAGEADFNFMKDIVKRPNCPGYNGYTRSQGQSPQVKTKTVYLPLIDLISSHPDTIMTALTKFKLSYPDQYSDVILRLGGMHSLMSFIGSIGTPMDNSGLSNILSEVFGGVQKMLTGK